jgi:hypothetical protein
MDGMMNFSSGVPFKVFGNGYRSSPLHLLQETVEIKWYIWNFFGSATRSAWLRWCVR